MVILIILERPYYSYAATLDGTGVLNNQDLITLHQFH